MIDLVESGLADAIEYADIQSRIEDISAAITIQRYGPVWTEHDTEPTRDGDEFDAVIAGAFLLRVYLDGVSDIEIERLADESGGDIAWITVAVSGNASLIDLTIAPSLVASGLTARVFYYSTDGVIKYMENPDISVNAFAAPVVVGAVADVIYLAAVSLTKVYYITENANHNRILHVYEDTGAWVNTDSDIYWPYPVHAFDAITFETGRDLLVLATDLPPLIGSRVVGAEVTQEVNEVQGIATFWVANGRWSDHDIIDTIDKVETEPSRTSLRLSFHNSFLFGAYLRCGATEGYPYSKAAVIKSKDGVNWEFPELIDSFTPPFAILPRSDYLYAVGVNKVLRSPCCAWAGQTPAELDVTQYVVGLESSAGEIRNSQVRLSNPADVLASTLATENARLQVVYDLGYVVGGSDLRVQVSTEDLVSRGQQAALPHQGIGLTTRDFLGRVNRVRSDYAAEWPGIQAGRDIYNDPSETGYGGLRHTAPYKGSWKTPGDEEIHLISGNKEGLAISTFVTDALNGSAETAFQVNTTSNGEYAGIAFRTFDKDNLHYFIYDQDTDKLKLIAGEGTDDDADGERDNTTLATSNSSMGWAVDTWYWLKIVVRYSLVYAFYSTDGITWVAVTWAGGGGTNPIELSGQTEWYDDAPCVLSGRFGLIGYGYSANDSWPPYDPPPWDPPLPPPPILDAPDIVYVRDSASKVWRTANWTDDPPTWTDITSTLAAVQGIRIDQANRYVFVFCTGGIWRASVDTASPAWVRIFDPLDLPASVATGPFGATTWRSNSGSYQVSEDGHLGLIAQEALLCGCGMFHSRLVLMSMPPGGSGKGDLIVAASDYACAGCCPVHGQIRWRCWQANVSVAKNTFRFGSGCGSNTSLNYIHTATGAAGCAAYTLLNEGATTGSRGIDWLGDLGSVCVCRMSLAGANTDNFIFTPNTAHATWTNVTPGTGSLSRFERDAYLDGHMIGGDKDYIYRTDGGAFGLIVARAALAGVPGRLQYCTCYYDDEDQLFLAVSSAVGTGYILTTRDRGVTWTDKTGAMGDRDYLSIRPVWTQAP